MYAAFKSVLLTVFRAPSEPPEAPAGAHGSVQVLRASPRYLTYRLLPLGLGVLAELALVAAGTLAGIVQREPGPFAGALLLAALVSIPLAVGYVFTRVDYELRYYVISDRSLRVRQGAWLVDEKTITFANVQNVHVTQGPLQRLFRISDVRLDTAGGGAAEGQAKGLHALAGHGVAIAGIENAADVRDTILRHLERRARDAGLGDLDDERCTTPRSTDLAAHAELLREIASAARALRSVAERPAGPA